MGVANDGSFYSYWPMPFRQGAVVELHNPAARLGDWSAGDATNDGWGGEEDLQVVLDNWNAGNPPPSVNVPEPGAAGLLGVVLFGAMRRRR